MRVLLTRPRADAEVTARLLAQRNIEAVIAPVIDISDISDVTLDLAGVQAVLFTSANGVRAFARAVARRDIPVFAVGDASAEATAECGFPEVTSAGGDVATLAALVGERLDPAAGALLHAAGSAVAGDLAGDLANHGFVVRRAQLYRAQTVDRLPVNAHRALEEGAVDAALDCNRAAGRSSPAASAPPLARPQQRFRLPTSASRKPRIKPLCSTYLHQKNNVRTCAIAYVFWKN
jgi:uroporphyrinogen-III synthase